ncbi:polysaccharide deacetylase family protein [Caproiciproducens sp. MSJ-32]|uniref:polysaccharide deacetylase family protein n=1 Tax=Caproiciproducens sp. MSJ-32 TaxID=2841527 RepID=UPI00256FC22B|nr:polysaccharide deacetylase family protein [Caproiciproducens sp. MSJ-32]
MMTMKDRTLKIILFILTIFLILDVVFILKIVGIKDISNKISKGISDISNKDKHYEDFIPNKELNDENKEKDKNKKTEVKEINTATSNYVDDVSKILPETLYKWDFYRQDSKKIAYLTFDDGPSREATSKILDILAANNIKATFFVLGTSIERNEKADELLKSMYNDGHTIANHGYSHDYSLLYPNGIIDVQAVIEDMNKNTSILKGILGDDFYTRIIRLPGGYYSWKGREELDIKLKELGLYQMDWNALNADADGKSHGKDQLMSNLINTVGDKDIIFVLMHDTDDKKDTVNGLQEYIDFLKEKGFEFRTLK